MKNDIEWMKREIEYTGFDKTEYGKDLSKMMDSLIELTKGDEQLMLKLSAYVTRLIEGKPLTHLTDNEDEWEIGKDNTKRNKRYSPVWMSSDGRVFDDHGICFHSPDMTNKWYNRASQKEVELPYYPITEYYPLDKAED